MKKHLFVLRSVVQAAFLLSCISGLCGCSLIGLGIGAASDGGKQDIDTLRVGTAMMLTPGDEIRISLVDSSVVEGTYKESALLDSATYARRYAQFLENVPQDVTFPRLGDTLFVHRTQSTLQVQYLFRGYGIGYLKLQRLDNSLTFNMLFTHLTSLEKSDGEVFNIGMLERMSKAGQLPSDVSLVVQSALGTSRVSLDDIEHIERENSKHAWLFGLGIGLAVDVIFVASIGRLSILGK